MSIIETKLPPMLGYVEVDVAGERMYKNVQTGVIWPVHEVGKDIQSTKPADQVGADLDYLAVLNGVEL